MSRLPPPEFVIPAKAGISCGRLHCYRRRSQPSLGWRSCRDGEV